MELAEEYGIDLSVTGEAGRPALKKRVIERRTPEDQMMSNPEYQNKLMQAVCEGLDEYFTKK